MSLVAVAGYKIRAYRGATIIESFKEILLKRTDIFTDLLALWVKYAHTNTNDVDATLES